MRSPPQPVSDKRHLTPDLNILNPLEHHRWDELLLTNPQSTFFHSLAWARVLVDTFGYTPLYFTVLENDRLELLLPVMEIASPITGKRGVSLPFTDICEPVVRDGVRFADAVEKVIQLGERSGWRTLVLEGGTRFLESKPPSHSYYTHRVDLTKSEEEIFAGFRGSSRRNVKKALRSGVEVQMCDSREALDRFLHLYAITRKRHGTAIEPRSYFENIYRHVISKGKGLVSLASSGGSCVATAVFFHFGKTVFYQFGASDLRAQHLRANNLIMWEAMKRYRLEGYETFSFGTTECDNDGLRQFKSGMASVEEPLGYYVYNFKMKDFIFHRSLHSPRKRKVLRITPVFSLKLLGKIFYKHTNSYYYLRKRDL